MSETDISVYTSTIYVVTKECSEALDILEIVEKDKALFNVVKQSWLRGIVADFLILRLAGLFDTKSGTVSLKRLPIDLKKRLPNDVLKRYISKLDSLEHENDVLISKLENNRNKRIAHMQKKDELGWTEKTIKQFREKNRYLQEINAVSDNLEFLTAKNLPRQELKDLLKKIQDLVFYEIDYSQYLGHAAKDSYYAEKLE